jgi:hypothetical protein
MKVDRYECDKCRKLFELDNILSFLIESQYLTMEYHLCFSCNRDFIVFQKDYFREWIE